MVEPVKLAEDPVTVARTSAVARCDIWSTDNCCSVEAEAVQDTDSATTATVKDKTRDILTAVRKEQTKVQLSPLKLLELFGTSEACSSSVTREWDTPPHFGTADPPQSQS